MEVGGLPSPTSRIRSDGENGIVGKKEGCFEILALRADLEEDRGFEVGLEEWLNFW